MKKLNSRDFIGQAAMGLGGVLQFLPATVSLKEYLEAADKLNKVGEKIKKACKSVFIIMINSK